MFSPLTNSFPFFIYARKSKYIEESESIDNQIKICSDYILSHIPKSKKENIKVYKDEDVSAKDTNRFYFKQMVLDYKKLKPKCIVCYRLDRISRSVSDFSSLIQDLNSQGIDFVSVKEQFDTSTPMGRAMMYISAVFAQMERETIADRIKDGMMFLATKGRNLGKIPTGFDSVEEKTTDSEGRVKISHYLKENLYIDTVKLIFDLFLKYGNVSIIKNYFAKNEIKTPRHSYFSDKSLKQILTNPVYCTADKDSFEYFKSNKSNVNFDKHDFDKCLGITSFNKINSVTRTKNDMSKWVIALGRHRGLISGKQWVQVQSVFAQKKGRPKSKKSSFLLSNLIKCEICGGNMRCSKDTRTTTTSTHRYVCGTKSSYGIDKCNSKNLPGQKTDEFVINYVKNFDEKKLKNDLGLRKYTRRFNNLDDKIDEINGQIQKLEIEKHKYIIYLKKLTPQSPLIHDIEKEVSKINSSIEDLSKQKNKLKSDLNSTSAFKYDALQILENLRNFKLNFDNLDFEHKKALLRLVVNKLTWNGHDLKVYLTGEK